MTPAQSRSLGGGLLALAVIVWSWAFDLQEQTRSLQQPLERTTDQISRLRQSAVSSTTTAVPAQPEFAPVDNAALRLAAAGFGSNAQNMAAALSRVRNFCVGAALLDCKVRRGSAISLGVANVPVAASGIAAARVPASDGTGPLSPYAVNLTATFNPKSMNDLVTKFNSKDLLHRIDKIVINQNRSEIDIVFWHSAELRQTLPKARAVTVPSPPLRPAANPVRP